MPPAVAIEVAVALQATACPLRIEPTRHLLGQLRDACLHVDRQKHVQPRQISGDLVCCWRFQNSAVQIHQTNLVIVDEQIAGMQITL
jgi:hypothetical protein